MGIHGAQLSLDRRPDWRWLVACGRISRARRDVPLDAATRLAVRFLRELRQARSPIGKQACHARMPTMAAAYRLRFGEPELRLAVEARMLAEDRLETISALTSLDVRTVKLYAELYFDVADRLQCTDFIRTRVIQLDPPTKDPAVVRRRAVLMLAWLFGPASADFLLLPAAHPEPGADEPLGLMGTAERLRVSNLAYRDAVLATAARPFNEREVQKLAGMLTARELSGAQRSDRDGDDVGLDLLKQMVEGMSKHLDAPVPEYLRKYSNSHVEPSSGECELLARGIPVPELDERQEYARQRFGTCEPEPPSDPVN
jgi:hypothetical protein